MNMSDIVYIKSQCIGKSQEVALAALQSRFAGKTVTWQEQPAGLARVTVNGEESRICMKGTLSPT